MVKPTKPINVTGKPNWNYCRWEMANKPGYLSAKFAKIRREMKEQQEQKVQPIRKVG